MKMLKYPLLLISLICLGHGMGLVLANSYAASLSGGNIKGLSEFITNPTFFLLLGSFGVFFFSQMRNQPSRSEPSS
ncbi:hypothetical protein QPR65_22330 (plasmid) [Enterobacter hormaechei]|uniref:hypothetical protein n=1 Tax=Enterobacter hormaechei TaxID=158836 RepID=UPI0027D3221E|nr:hypothetical protein [Enterobacter hormaechei]WLZ51979.1 hypothetical protein QPR65_22330 [Enterobacter hormaechei]